MASWLLLLSSGASTQPIVVWMRQQLSVPVTKSLSNIRMIMLKLAPLFRVDHVNVHYFDGFRGDESCSYYSALLNQEVIGRDGLLCGKHLNFQFLLFNAVVSTSVFNVQFLMFVAQFSDKHLNVKSLLLHLQNYFRSDRVPHLGSATMANYQQIQP